MKGKNKMTDAELVKLLKKHNIKLELGATYSIKCQVAQLQNLIEDISSQLEPLVVQKIAEVVKNKKQKYLDWLKLPRYQEETSDEYYADIQAITEDLQKVIDFIDSNFSA